MQCIVVRDQGFFRFSLAVSSAPAREDGTRAPLAKKQRWLTSLGTPAARPQLARPATDAQPPTSLSAVNSQQLGMDVEELAGGVDRLNLGDAPEAGALAAAVATAAVGATSSPASESGFSKAADDNPSSNQDGTQMDSLRGGSQAPGAGPVAHDKDNDVEGKLFIGGISWQTTEEGLRYSMISQPARNARCEWCDGGWRNLGVARYGVLEYTGLYRSGQTSGVCCTR